MTQLRAFFAGLIAVFLVASMPATASAGDAFSAEALSQAQQAGKPILVDVYASWCPTCRAQQPVLAGVTSLPKYKDLVVLKADFDNDKEALKALGVQKQSTLIVFKGDKEVDRSIGSTDPVAIEGMLDQAL